MEENRKELKERKENRKINERRIEKKGKRWRKERNDLENRRK